MAKQKFGVGESEHTLLLEKIDVSQLRKQRDSLDYHIKKITGEAKAKKRAIERKREAIQQLLNAAQEFQDWDETNTEDDE